MPSTIENLIDDELKQLKLIKKQGNLKEEAQLCKRIGSKYESLNDFNHALKYYHFNMEISQTIKNNSEVLSAFVNKMRVLHKLGYSTYAKNELENKINSIDNFDIDPLIQLIHTYITIASNILATRSIMFKRNYYKIFFAKLEFLEHLIANSESLDESQKHFLICETRIFKSSLLIEIKEFSKAINILEQNVVPKNDKQKSEILGLIGDCTARLFGWNKAIEDYYDKQLILSRTSNCPNSIANALERLGLAYLELRDFDLAENTFFLLKDFSSNNYLSVDFIERARKLIDLTIYRKESLDEIAHLKSRLKHSPGNFDLIFKIITIYKEISFFVETFEFLETIIKHLDQSNLNIFLKLLENYASICFELEKYELAEQSYEYISNILQKETASQDNTYHLVKSLISLAHAQIFLKRQFSQIIQIINTSIELSTKYDLNEELLESFSLLQYLYNNDKNEDNEKTNQLYEKIENLIFLIQSTQECRLDDITIFLQNEDSSYFQDRKASKSLMKLMACDYIMTSKVSKSKKTHKEKNIKKNNNRNINKNLDLKDFIADDYINYENDYSIHKNNNSFIGNTIVSNLVINIRIEKIIISITCIEMDKKFSKLTVNWIIKRAEIKYSELYGLKPIISSLENSHGMALLDSNLIQNVIKPEEILVAKILEWDIETVRTEYEYQCHANQLPISNFLLSRLVSSPIIDIRKIHLSMLSIEGRDYWKAFWITLDRLSEFVDFLEIDISCCNPIDDRILGEIFSLSNLSMSIMALNIGYTDITSFDIRKLPNLTCLNVEFCHKLKFCNFLENFTLNDHHTKLKELDISYLSSDEFASNFFSKLNHINSLEKLFLDGIKFDDSFILELELLIRTNNSLSDLYLRATDINVNVLGQILAQNHTIKRVYIDDIYSEQLRKQVSESLKIIGSPRPQRLKDIFKL